MARADLDEIVGGLLEWGKYLPHDTEHPIEVLVLRGHLLIERELRRLIEEKFIRPSAFDLDRSKFSHLMRLAEALYGESGPELVWEGLKQLNALRNSLAHNLEDETLQKRVEKLIEKFKDQNPEIFKHVKPEQLDQLAYCIASIHLELLKMRPNKN